ncbi:MAG: helix-turn-helix domain-containing protein, partial [Pseudomonadota bacterium]
MSESDFQGPARGRPRSAATEQAIFSAARALLTEEGYDGVTIEGVARRAGVGKQTIYRRFDGKAQLLIAAFRDDAELMVALPTSDTLEEALSVYLSSVFKAVNNSRAALKFL